MEAVTVSSTSSTDRATSHGIWTTSGLLFAENYVLTTGTALLPFADDPPRNKWRTLISSPSRLHADRSFENIKFNIYKGNKDEVGGLEKLNFAKKGKLTAVWKCSLLEKALTGVLKDWTVGNVRNGEPAGTEHEGRHEGDITKEILTLLVLLRYADEPEGVQEDGDEYSVRDAVSALTNLLLHHVTEPVRGKEIEIISTPFGNKLFSNSLSRGVISNVVGPEKCLILTDARTVPGCEGGPIFETVEKPSYEKASNKLVGLVICPLTWWRGEWVGLTIGISLMSILRKLLQNHNGAVAFLQPTYFTKSGGPSFFDPKLLEIADECVVLVQCDEAWGSGVVFDFRSVITCSHVVKGSTSISVFWMKKRCPAKVIYRTPDDAAYDLAVITLQNDTFERSVEFCEKPARVGDEVVAVGFPFFVEKDEPDLRPSLVLGCIAKVDKYMLQTTCCIQSGFSGGALLKGGKLLGIIISNARDSTLDALYPHINFIIPSFVFQKVLSLYSKTNNIECLKALESTNNFVQSLWAIGNSKL